ncbi:MAG: flagellar basal body-associated FliL family protein [Anaerolineaceae bacterium]|nr:flagellar basal body-associated FliL family protein [Anaerolineaceae bacterium]
MKKLLPILNIVSKIMTFIGMTIVVIVSLASAYIIFAPDNLPKPFRLMYDYTTPTVAPNDPKAIPTPTPVVYKPGDGIMVNMSTKIINLQDQTGSKYIRVTIVLEFAPDNPAYASMAADAKTAYVTDFQSRVNARMPVLDDTVITLLSTKTFQDLYTADGKEKLRQQIMQAIAAKMPDFKILSIYFTEFVVQ